MQDVAAIPGVMRLRLGSLEPGIVTEEFAAEIAKIPEFCPSFHLSMQSGCDATLARMKRKYSTADFMEKCELLRAHFDRPSITTDIITGFPGETEEEFAQTEEFVRRVEFARTHIFKYSVRKGTAAERMPGQNTEKTKAARSAVLQSIDKERRVAYAESFVGETVSVLFEDRTVIDGKSMLTGYTREYVPVLMETEEDLMNRILDVRAESVTPRGEIIASLIE
jgi:threonylcarbamoyladenosine tRNA methylthiotransferase MtaB